MPITCYASNAALSPCKLYRHDLRRFWGRAPYCLWIMLNPSTADASVNDRTICKCMAFSERWGYGGMIVVNLFDYRSTHPEALLKVPQPYSNVNDLYIKGWAAKAEKVIVGWGTYGEVLNRGLEVGRMLEGMGKEMWCLYVNEGGQPKHPLYVSGSTELKRWTPKRIVEK